MRTLTRICRPARAEALLRRRCRRGRGESAKGCASAAPARMPRCCHPPPLPNHPPANPDTCPTAQIRVCHLNQLTWRRNASNQQVDFIVSAYGKHSDGGQPLTRVLELGCGPARHSILLALRDYRVTALDASDSMLNYARGRAQEARAGAIQLVKGQSSRALSPPRDWDCD